MDETTVMDWPQLEYARPAAPRACARPWTRVSGSLFLAFVLTLGWLAVPRAWGRIRTFYWQHKALAFLPAADRVVYDDDPAHFRQLIESSEFAEMTGSYSGHTAIRAEAAWERFSRLALPPRAGRMDATLFLHERRNSRGEPRLILISDGSPRWAEEGPRAPETRRQFRCWSMVIRPATVFSDPIVADERMLYVDAGPYAPTDRLQWIAGQIDACDPAHFTMVYRQNGMPFTMDGFLNDDDTITLQRRRRAPLTPNQGQ